MLDQSLSSLKALNDHALKLEFVPDWIAIVGSGYIGLEFSDVYTALGSQMTFIEALDQLMPGFDPEIGKLAQRCQYRDQYQYQYQYQYLCILSLCILIKNHSLRAPPFVHKVESSLLPKEAFQRDDRLRLSHSSSVFPPFPGEESGNDDNFNESPSEYLHYIAFKCGTKVEFRQALTPSVDLQFSVEIWFAGEKIGEGNGRTRREAPHQAAEASLMNLAGNIDADKYLSRAKSGTSSVYGEEGRFPLDGSEKTPRNGEAKSTKLKEYKLPKDDNRPQRNLNSNHDVVHPKNHKGPINLRLQDEDEEDYEEHEDYDEEEHEVDSVREENIGSTSHGMLDLK
ncbi:hypothetical protein LXL04_019223 [Taraxacum kok-saghyz]